MNTPYIPKCVLALMIAVLLLVLAGCEPQLVTPQSGQGVSPLRTPIPPPTIGEVEPTPIVLQNGQTLHMPTWTPWPTFPPPPTPTRRPGPTATPMPLRSPAKDASGVLLYAARGDKDQFARQIGVIMGQGGHRAGDPAPYWPSLDFEPTYPQPSPNGRYILFLRPVEPAGIPYILDRHDKRIWPLFDEKLYNTQLIGLPFGWHPDGRQVLLWVQSGDGLWLVDVESGERTIIAFTINPPQGAAVSPDGQRVAYVIRSGENFSDQLWISYADGSSPRLISDVYVSTLFSWSPNGRYLLLKGGPAGQTSKDGSPGKGPVWLLNPDTLELRPLGIECMPIGAGPFDALWSPDSRYVAGTGVAPGEKRCIQTKGTPSSEVEACLRQVASVYVEDVETGEIRSLSYGLSPRWSPDGSRLAFLSYRSGKPEIWTIGVDGAGLEQVTFDGDEYWKEEYYLVWMPPEGGAK